MPTPSPSIVPSVAAIDGTETTWPSRPIRLKPGREPEDRGQDRDRHRRRGPEGEEQHDDRHGDPDELARLGAGRGDGGAEVGARRDLDPRLLGRVREGDQLLCFVLLERVRTVPEGQRDVGIDPVLGDVVGACVAVGADDRADLRILLVVLNDLLDGRLVGSLVEPALGRLERDRDGAVRLVRAASRRAGRSPSSSRCRESSGRCWSACRRRRRRSPDRLRPRSRRRRRAIHGGRRSARSRRGDRSSSAREDRLRGAPRQRHHREHRIRAGCGRERARVPDPDPGSVVQLSPGPGDRRLRIGAHPAATHLMGAEQADLTRRDRELPDRGDELLEIVAPLPDRGQAAQRLHLPDPARLHDPRHLRQAAMQVGDVEIVA